MKKQSVMFKKMVEFFKDLEYTLKTELVTCHTHEDHPDYWFALISGKNIKGGFCEPNGGDSYWYIDGRISFDHVDCFDKWSKCPYCLKLPETMQDFKYIIDRMNYLRTKEGFNKSNCFEINEKDYPHSKYILCPVCKGTKMVEGKKKTLRMKKCPKCRANGKIKRPVSNTLLSKESV